MSGYILLCRYCGFFYLFCVESDLSTQVYAKIVNLFNMAKCFSFYFKKKTLCCKPVPNIQKQWHFVCLSLIS